MMGAEKRGVSSFKDHFKLAVVLLVSLKTRQTKVVVLLVLSFSPFRQSLFGVLDGLEPGVPR